MRVWVKLTQKESSEREIGIVGRARVSGRVGAAKVELCSRTSEAHATR